MTEMIVTKKLRYVSFFDNLEDIHLLKDVTQIAYALAQSGKVDASLVAIPATATDWPHLAEIRKYLDIQFLSTILQVKYWKLGTIHFLLRQAKSIDILHLFHYTPATFLYGILYKKMNPRGVLYVKLDNDLRALEVKGSLYNYGTGKFTVFLKSLERHFLNIVDCVSIETDKGQALIQEHYPELKDKVFCSFNGIASEQFIYTELNATQKENRIITVARLGMPQKNTEGLLLALARVNLRGWKAYLVGPIAEDFQPKIAEFYLKYPQLKDVIIFTGNIADRHLVAEHFAKAKIFCLPSHWESFGLVLIEALAYGDYAITTAHASAADIVSSVEQGVIVPLDDQVTLEKTLQESIDRLSAETPSVTRFRSYVLEKFDWKGITDDLWVHLSQLTSQKTDE